MSTFEGYLLASLPDFAGRELGASDWVLVDQQRIQDFADCTGDQQWIHTDPERCRLESPTGTPIAHGMLSLSLVAKLLMDVGVVPPDASRVINAGINNVRFRAPVRSGSRVRALVTVSTAVPKSEGRVLMTVAVVLEIEGEREPALAADVVLMMVP